MPYSQAAFLLLIAGDALITLLNAAIFHELHMLFGFISLFIRYFALACHVIYLLGAALVVCRHPCASAQDKWLYGLLLIYMLSWPVTMWLLGSLTPISFMISSLASFHG